MIAAFLWAQLQQATQITKTRIAIWQHYHALLEAAEVSGILRRPTIPADCTHNAHLYYVILPDHVDRQMVLEELKRQAIRAVFHYVPLHSSPAGLRYGRFAAEMTITNTVSEQLIRLPLWIGLTTDQQAYIVDCLIAAIAKASHKTRSASASRVSLEGL